MIRPEISGLWALSSGADCRGKIRTGYQTKLLTTEELGNYTFESRAERCKGCGNRCLLTVNRFSDGTRFVSGNRCEKGSGRTEKSPELPNLYKLKYQRLFRYTPLKESEAKRGTVGIPRVLNMYEDYPFGLPCLRN